MKLMKFGKTLKDAQFGIVESKKIIPLTGVHSVSGAFAAIASGRTPKGKPIPLADVIILPPTDENVHIYCAGLNYLDHAKEIRQPAPSSPIFFTKAGGSLCGPHEHVIYPRSISLLDYEIELAVVIGRPIGEGDFVTHESLPDFVLGIAIINDISARDLQLSRGQWFLGKSFRTFAPLGPIVQTIDREVQNRLYDLNMKLTVYTADGKLSNKGQSGNTGDMIFKLPDLINTLSGQFDLSPGDVVATGTPRGVALSRPARWKERLAEIIGMPQAKRIQMFIESEKKHNARYLRPGDSIVSTITSSDGYVDLGTQKNFIA